jgi:HlyD family secretion protein
MRGLVLRHLGFGLTIVLVAAISIGMPGVTIGRSGSDGSGFSYLTAAVQRGDVSTTLSATGALRALVTVEVGSQLSGQIAELLVDFNDQVTEGEPLARLDPRTFESKVRGAEAGLEVARADVLKQCAELKTAAANVASARHSLKVAEAHVESTRAKLTAAERDLKRKRALAEAKVVAAANVDEAASAYESAVADLHAAEAEVEVAREAVVAAAAGRSMADANLLYAQASEREQAAELDQARIDLERTVISAPIDGVVIGREVDRGQTVAASLESPTLFTLARDLREMEVEANVDEADIGRIRLGQRATFSVDAYPNRTFAGVVIQIRKAPQLIQNVVTYTVVLSTQNPDLALLPGMTALVNVVVDEARDILNVPNAALRFQPPGDTIAAAAGEMAGAGGGAVVWMPGDGGAPVPVRVALGRSNESVTEIVEGSLRAGQHVIVGTASTPEEQSWFGFRWKL